MLPSAEYESVQGLCKGFNELHIIGPSASQNKFPKADYFKKKKA